jgi:hypothetical protein
MLRTIQCPRVSDEVIKETWSKEQELDGVQSLSPRVIGILSVRKALTALTALTDSAQHKMMDNEHI